VVNTEVNWSDLYRGKDIQIDDDITLRHPTLDDICDYGERQYAVLVNQLCAVGADLKWQLNDVGIDYTKVEDFELFYSYTVNILASIDTSIMFGDLDFSSFKPIFSEELDEPVLYSMDSDIMISRYTYQSITTNVRAMNMLKRNSEIPANEETRIVLIEEAKEIYERNKDVPYNPRLINEVSALLNSGKSSETYNTVFSLPVYVFYNHLKRANRVIKSNLLLQSGYSGFGINLKELNETEKKELDWCGNIN